MAITIDNKSIDERPWGDVDKAALKSKLKKALEDKVAGAAEAIKEVYAIVGSLDDPSSWKEPHHSLSGSVVRLNRKGVSAAAQRLSSVAGGDKKQAAKHLLSHYQEDLKEDAPESLVEAAKSFDYNQISEVVAAKKLSLKMLGDGTILKTMFLSVESPVIGEATEAQIELKSILKDASSDGMSDLDEFNKYAGVLEPQTADTVKLYKFYAAGQQVDLQNDKFLEGGLQDLANVLKTKPILEDHKWNTPSTIGVIYNTYLVNRSGQKMLVEKVGILNMASTKETIQKIDSGAIKYVSVGFAVDPEKYTCSSCKQPILSMACKHRPGMVDEKGNKVVALIGGVKYGFETSLTPVPAQLNTKISKSVDSDSEQVQDQISEPIPSEPIAQVVDPVVNVPPVTKGESKSLDNIHLGNTGASVVADKPNTQDATQAPAAQEEQKPAATEQAQENKEMSLGEIADKIKSESVEDEETKDRSVLISGKMYDKIVAGLESAKAAATVVPTQTVTEIKVVDLKSAEDLIAKQAEQITNLTNLVNEVAVKLEKTAELQKAQTAMLSKAMTKPQGNVNEALLKEMRPEEPNEHWLRKHARKVGVEVGG